MFSFTPACGAARGGQGLDSLYKKSKVPAMEGGGQRAGSNKEMSSILPDQ